MKLAEHHLVSMLRTKSVFNSLSTTLLAQLSCVFAWLLQICEHSSLPTFLHRLFSDLASNYCYTTVTDAVQLRQRWKKYFEIRLLLLDFSVHNYSWISLEYYCCLLVVVRNRVNRLFAKIPQTILHLSQKCPNLAQTCSIWRNCAVCSQFV